MKSSVIGVITAHVVWVVAGRAQLAFDSLSYLLSKVNQTNKVEVELGTMAMERGSSLEVRRFGELLLRDHQAADEKILAEARRKNISILDVSMLSPDEIENMQAERADIEKMKTLSGVEFDTAFLQLMQEGHKAPTAWLRPKLDTIDDADIRELLLKIYPILEQHHALAGNLLAQRG